MCRSMNEHNVVRVKEIVMATPNFEDTAVEIKSGWRGTIIANADKPTPCVEFNEDHCLVRVRKCLFIFKPCILNLFAWQVSH